MTDRVPFWWLPACAIVLACAIVAVRAVRDWLTERRPLVNEWCCHCGEHLRRGQVYEVRKDMPALADEGASGGGTQMACSYCKQHAPVEAKRL